MHLAHHGIKGQKWGVRRFQNPDGSYTEAGKRRRGREIRKLSNKSVSKEATKKDVKNFERASLDFINKHGTDNYYKYVVNSGLRHAGRVLAEQYGIFPSDPAYLATRRVAANYDYISPSGEREINKHNKYKWYDKRNNN